MSLCESCKALCCRLAPILVSDEEAAQFGDAVVPYKGALSLRVESDGYCTMLDRATHRCSIYETRPEVCRLFEMGGSRCRSLRSTIRTAVPSTNGDRKQ